MKIPQHASRDPKALQVQFHLYISLLFFYSREAEENYIWNIHNPTKSDGVNSN